MRRVRVNLLAVGALGLGLTTVGCGMAPEPSVLPTPEPIATPSAPPDALSLGKSLMQAVGHEGEQTRNWTAVGYSEVVGPHGERDFNRSRLLYKRGGCVIATILSAKESRQVGTRLRFDGANTMTLKTYFFGILPLTLSLPVNDPRLLDVYGRSLKDTSTEQLFKVLLDPNAVVRYLGPSTYNQEPIWVAEVKSANSWHGVSREVVGISQRLTLPIFRDCYDQAGLRMTHLELNGMRVNIPVGPHDFDL